MRQLLPPNTGLNTTGPWVRVEPAAKPAFPVRVSAVGNWTGDNIFIEELVGGLPGALSQFGNTNSPYGPNSDTGSVNQIGVMAPGTTSLVIDETVEFIRARTGAFTGGTTVTVCGVEMRE